MSNQRQLIVCEKGNRWAVALRGVFDSDAVRVFETRTWQAARDAIQDGQSNLLALELRRGNLSEVVRGIVWARARFPATAVLVLADRAMSECEWIVREAGAVHFTSSPRDLVPIARLATRILATHQTPAPDILEATMQRLPWGE